MGAKSLSFDIALNTQGYVSGAQNAAKSTKQLENSTKEYLQSFGSLKKQFGDARRSAESLAVQYRLLSKTEKESEMGKQMAADMDFAIRKAAELKDVISDTNQAIKRSSSDTQGLDAMKDAMEIGKDLATAYAGAVARLTNNEKAYKDMIATIAMIQGGFNAAIKIANALQSQSNIMIAIGNLQLKAKAAAEELATKKTIAATVAQRIFNTVAKANPYVLLATVILAAAAAIGTYIAMSKKAKKEDEEMQKAVKKLKDIQSDYVSNMASKYGQLMGEYSKLRASWKKLSSDHEKTQWIKENKSKLHELGIEVKSVKDAEKALDNQSASVVESFRKRAKAAALAAKAVALYTEAMNIEATAEERYTSLQKNAGDKATLQDAQKGRATLNNRTGEYEYTAKGAVEANKALWETDPKLKSLREQYAKLQDQIEDNENAYEKLAGSIKEVNKETGKSSKKEVNANFKLGNDVDKEIRKDLANKVKDVAKDESNRIKKVKTNMRLDFDANVNIKGEHVKTQIQTAFADATTGIFDNVFDKNKLDFSFLSESTQKAAEKGVKNLDEISEAMAKAERAKIDYQKAGNLEGVASMEEQITNLTSAFDAQAEALQTLSDKSKQIETMSNTFQNLGNYVGQVGGAFTMLGEAVGSKGLQAFGIIAETIANIMLSFSQALVQAATMGPWAWIAFGIQGIAQVAAMVAQIKEMAAGSYAEGGVIPGSSYTGDKLFARVNSGERVLTARQNKRLEEIANSVSGAGIFAGQSITVHGVVKGKDLMLVQKNYNTIASRAGQTITF